MALIAGTELNPSQRQAVLDAFLWRWTSDNPHRRFAYGDCRVCGKPGGEPEPRLNTPARLGCRAIHPVSRFMTDAEWLEWHTFEFEPDGHALKRRGHRNLPQASLVPWEERGKELRYP